MPSKQDGSPQTVFPDGPSHFLLAQSSGAVHGVPVGQPKGHIEPQSMATSPPFNIPSLHVGAAQIACTQDKLVQSRPSRHGCPMPHAMQSGPPQSMSVSDPL